MLTNDADVDNDALSAVLVSGPAHGTLTLNANGSFTYTPDADYNSTDSFTYKANDGIADSNVETVTLTVNAVDDPPTAVSLSSAVIAENTPSGTLVGTFDAADLDSSEFSYFLIDGAGGRFAIDGNQLLVANGVALDFEQNGSHDVTVRVTDSSGSSFDQVVSIAVSNVDPDVVTGTVGNDIIFGGILSEF